MQKNIYGFTLVALLLVTGVSPAKAEARAKSSKKSVTVSTLSRDIKLLKKKISNIQMQSGPVGPVGPAGAVGPQGPVGPAGQIGPVGERGLVGATGATGAQGLPGATGATGARGEQGPIGPQGQQGIPGQTGATGATGAQGPSGEMPSISFTAQQNECVTMNLREICGGIFGCSYTFTRLLTGGTSTYGFTSEMRFQNPDIQGDQGGTRYVSLTTDFDHIWVATTGAGVPIQNLACPYNDFCIQNHRSGCSNYQSPQESATGSYIDPYVFTLRSIPGRVVAVKFTRN